MVRRSTKSSAKRFRGRHYKPEGGGAPSQEQLRKSGGTRQQLYGVGGSGGTSDLKRIEQLRKAGKQIPQELQERAGFAKRQQEKTTQAEINAFYTKYGIVPKAQPGMRPEEELSTLYKTGVSDVTRAEETTQQVSTEVEEGGLGLQPGIGAPLGVGGTVTGGIAERGIQDPLKEVVMGAIVTASALTGFKLGTSIITSSAAGQVPIFYNVPQTVGKGAGRIAANTKTAGLLNSWVGKLGVAAGISFMAISLIKDAISNVIFGQFIGQEEAPQTLGFAFQRAKEMDDVGLMEEINKLHNETLTPTVWESIPYTAGFAGLKKFKKDSDALLKANKKYVEWFQDQPLGGQTGADIKEGEQRRAKFSRLNSERIKNGVESMAQEDRIWLQDYEAGLT